MSGATIVQLEAVQVEAIPRLAYCAVADGDAVRLYHGVDVEVHDGWFTDGAWAGDFADGRLDESFLCGTGGRVTAEGVRLVAGPNPADRLLLTAHGDGWVFSNSLPFLLAMTDDELDPGHLGYRSLFRSLLHGLRIGRRTLPTKGGASVRLIVDETVDLVGRGIRRSRRPIEGPFGSYAAYRDHLVSTMRRVAANAADAGRHAPLAPIVTASGGYDSTAAMVLAAEVGCREAVTLLRRDGEDGSGALIDHPGAVAEKVGVEVVGLERDTWRLRDDLPEADLAASGLDLSEVALLALDDAVAGRLVFGADAGDAIWSRDVRRAYDDIVRGDVGGQSMASHRLSVGYIMCSVPYIGFTAMRSIHEISRAPSMVPWSVGGHYDRPIARRIVEEAGADRSSFAVRKFGSAAMVGCMVPPLSLDRRDEHLDVLLEFMTPAGARSFLAFCDVVRPERFRRKAALVSVAHRAYTAMHGANTVIGLRLGRYGLTGIVPRRVLAWLGSWASVAPDLTYLYPHWGTSVLKARYAPVAALEAGRAR